MGHMGDTACLAEPKIRITTFGALGGLAFDSAYSIHISPGSSALGLIWVSRVDIGMI